MTGLHVRPSPVEQVFDFLVLIAYVSQ
jgi:hypothetical protein